jgi:mono/diheme cytochrome c family protein
VKKSLLAVLFGLVLILGACGGGGDDATEEPADTPDEPATEETEDGAEDTEGAEEGGSVDAAAGEEVYQQNCASCHGADLSGGAGPELTQVGSDLSEDEIRDIIVNGQGTMPGGLVEGDDLDAVVAWLSEQQ